MSILTFKDIVKNKVKSESLEISLLETRDIIWYTKNIKRRFFNEYMENSIEDIEDYRIIRELNRIRMSQAIQNIEGCRELRYTIKHGGQRVGGLTIYKTDICNVLELSYWVVPENQGLGIATRAIKSIIVHIKSNSNKITKLTLTIKKSNKSSIRLAERCGFTEQHTIEDKPGKHLIYELNIKEGR